VTTDVDVIIHPRAALLPLGINIGLSGKGFENALIQPLK
jgi:hypothetical protein